MAFSFRLDRETEARLRQLARRKGWSKAAVVREALEVYGAAAGPAGERRSSSVFDRLEAYAGVITTEGAQLSDRTHDKHRALVHRKHRGAGTR